MKSMEIISSRHNPTLKHVAKLLSARKYRQKQLQAVVEGVHLVESVVASSYALQQLIVAESSLANAEVEQLLKRSNRDALVVRDALFATISEVGVGAGILAVFQLPIPEVAPVLNGDAVVLEDVQDPGNVGAILRTAAAAGVHKAYLSNGCASVWAPKVLRAGMGAQFSLEIFEAVDLVDCVASSRVTTIATSLQAKESLYEQDLHQPVAWLFGNEGQGLSLQLEKQVSKTITIPQADNTVESLNVAAAAAVCLFEQRRQRLV